MNKMNTLEITEKGSSIGKKKYKGSKTNFLGIGNII